MAEREREQIRERLVDHRGGDDKCEVLVAPWRNRNQRESHVQLVDEEDNNRVKERRADGKRTEQGIRMEKREGSNVVYQFEGVVWSFLLFYFFSKLFLYIYIKKMIFTPLILIPPLL